jgi:hypothetical protein
MNFMIYRQGIKYFKNILMLQISHDDASITFKFHNFVQVTFYHQCEELYNTFIYLNQYVGHVILSME